MDTQNPVMLPPLGERFFNGMLLSHGNKDRTLVMGDYFHVGHIDLYDLVHKTLAPKGDKLFQVKWAGEMHFRNPLEDRSHVAQLERVNTTSQFAFEEHPWAVDGFTREVWLAARIHYALPFEISKDFQVELFHDQQPNLWRSLGRFSGYHFGHRRRQGFINLVWAGYNFILLAQTKEDPLKFLHQKIQETPAAFDVLLKALQYYCLSDKLEPDMSHSAYRSLKLLCSRQDIDEDQMKQLVTVASRLDNRKLRRADLFELEI